MATDIWEYFGQREKEIEAMSLDGSSVEYSEETGSEGTIGHMIGQVFFEDRVFLAIHERVEVGEDGRVHRTDYAYFLVIDGVEYWGYERDPSHDPPVHRHTYGHAERLDADPISFKEACEMGWHEISLRSGVTE